MRRNWTPLKASRGGPNISHLLFADDLLFFAESTTEQVEVIKSRLPKFEKAFGHRVNYSKSHIFLSPNLKESEV